MKSLIILSEIVDELKGALEHEPQATDKEQKKVHREKKKKNKGASGPW